LTAWGKGTNSADRNSRYLVCAAKWALILWISVIALSSTFSALAQSLPAPAPGGPQTPASGPPEAPGGPQSGSISGTVVDQDGAVIANVRVVDAPEGATSNRELLTDSDGHFVLASVAPGPFHLTLTAPGFAAQEKSGVLHAGEDYVIPQIELAVATATVDVQVLPPDQVAEQQVKAEEKQRLLGVIPNFYVSYEPNPVALTAKQKLQLAWKTTVDPVSFAITGAIAGIEQADNEFSGYGQGAQGYAKRYGAAYADFVAGTFIGSALLPSLLKQDPRYFYKGSGSRKSRFLYAMANAVICKGDNGRWQPNYSSILGGLAAGGISNLYYPARNRDGAGLTFENGFIAVGAGAVGNVIQEFFLRKITPHVPDPDPTQP
jgi:Carboxypeptidase regulatory-like domain